MGSRPGLKNQTLAGGTEPPERRVPPTHPTGTNRHGSTGCGTTALVRRQRPEATGGFLGLAGDNPRVWDQRSFTVLIANACAVDITNVRAVLLANVCAVLIANVCTVDIAKVRTVLFTNVRAVLIANVRAVDIANVRAVLFANVRAVLAWLSAVDAKGTVPDVPDSTVSLSQLPGLLEYGAEGDHPEGLSGGSHAGDTNQLGDTSPSWGGRWRHPPLWTPRASRVGWWPSFPPRRPESPGDPSQETPMETAKERPVERGPLRVP